MDSNCTAVLDKINSLAPLGRYVIISDDEFSDVIADGKNKGEILNRALFALQSEGFIDVKYSRQNTYCVAPLKKREPQPVREEPQIQPEPERARPLSSPFFAAFCGGAAGSLLISLIFALI